MPPTEVTPVFSGRGETLTQAHHNALVNLCLSNKSDKPFKEHTKKFWTDVSRLFFMQTRRPYSWQSCRRQMVKWELRSQLRTETPSRDSRVPQGPRPQLDVPEPLNDHTAVTLPCISRLYTGCSCSCHLPQPIDSSDDGLLPDLPLPPVRPNIDHIAPGGTPYIGLSTVVAMMEKLETQLLGFVSAVSDEPTDCFAVQDAFQELKDEILELPQISAHDRWRAEVGE